MGTGHDSRSFFFEGPAGPLEAILWTPLGARRPALVCLVCHPHPLFGGTMHNKVVYQVAKSLDAQGLPVLRFNFRGTGKSAGSHDHGNGEQGDVRAALDFLASEFSGAPQLVAGFSFGSMVGLQVGCEDPRVQALIGLGLPVDRLVFPFLAACGKPKLFVQGGRDQFGAIAKARELFKTVAEPKQLVEVGDADHFFVGKLDQVDRAIQNWVAKTIVV